MIYELQAWPHLNLPDIFAYLPGRGPGFAMWAFFVYASATYALKTRGQAVQYWRKIPVPMLLAWGIYTGLFITLYHLIDEVSINLEHPYNLFHYGRFSMSPDRWVDGTVECVYYLLHAPFAWSQHSLIVANYAIGYVVGLLHLLLAYRTLEPVLNSSTSTLRFGAFAISGPLTFLFASGFGNGLVSLVLLAAICSAVNGKVAQSLIWSGVLPLLRPDALFLACMNPVALAVAARLLRRSLVQKRHLPLLAIPVVALGCYYVFFRMAYGHWVPTPVRFKAFVPAMLSMFSSLEFLFTFLGFCSSPPRVIGLVLLAGFWRKLRTGGGEWLRSEDRERTTIFAVFATAALPLLLFYGFVHATIVDFSFGTFARYWIAFDLGLLLFTLSALPVWRELLPWNPANVGRGWMGSLEKPGYAHLAFFLCSIPLLAAMLAYARPLGRIDGMFAGALAERYFPPEFTIASTEMSTFGLMLERPVIDLWGYTTPPIAFSNTCNGDKIRANDRFFLSAKPDAYWLYWFTKGFSQPAGDTFDSVETELATFHHTSKTGSLLGDMTEVFREYDVVQVKANGNQAAFLVRKSSREALMEHLQRNGFEKTRERSINLPRFKELYDRETLIQFRCG